MTLSRGRAAMRPAPGHAAHVGADENASCAVGGHHVVLIETEDDEFFGTIRIAAEDAFTRQGGDAPGTWCSGTREENGVADVQRSFAFERHYLSGTRHADGWLRRVSKDWFEQPEPEPRCRNGHEEKERKLFLPAEEEHAGMLSLGLMKNKWFLLITNEDQRQFHDAHSNATARFEQSREVQSVASVKIRDARWTPAVQASLGLRRGGFFRRLRGLCRAAGSSIHSTLSSPTGRRSGKKN